MSKLTDDLQRQFNLLNKKRDEILAKSGPLREARDKHVNEARAIENKMNLEIKEIEKELYELDTDRAALARALGGRRMSDAIR